jgi:hypothetical protein
LDQAAKDVENAGKQESLKTETSLMDIDMA